MPVFASERPAFVGGEWAGARSGGTLEVTEPATGRSLGTIPRLGPDDVDRAVQAGIAAQREWRAAPVQERAAALHAIADALEARGDELSAIDSADNGSPRHEMRKDVGLATAQLRYFAGLGLQLRGDTIPGEHDRLSYTLRQPYGVVARILAFNHPLMFTAAKLAAPLMAGNAVLIKPSEHTSLSSLALAEDLERILPKGLVSILTGLGSEVGDALAAHPEIRRLAFIGSAPTGRAIQRRAAEAAVKSVTLELGGKNPIVVLPDADVDLAIEGALKGMNFTWQGQSCGSTSRLLVHADLHDDFVSKLAERMDALRSGPPDDPATGTGSLVNDAQLEKVLRYIDIGREEGAQVVTGGRRVTDGELANGRFVRPTLFTGVRPDSRLAQEEIFGPVLAAIRFEDPGEALRIANGIGYGLTASIFTGDLAAAHRFARDVEAGYVWVNETGRHVPAVPFGGIKESGVGTEEDIDELYSYTVNKSVHVRFGR